jgi:hypothetical protein
MHDIVRRIITLVIFAVPFWTVAIAGHATIATFADTNDGNVTNSAHRSDGNHFVVHADEKLMGFLQLEPAIPKIALTLYLGRCQSRSRVKSVRRLHPELHLTLFPRDRA